MQNKQSRFDQSYSGFSLVKQQRRYVKPKLIHLKTEEIPLISPSRKSSSQTQTSTITPIKVQRPTSTFNFNDEEFQPIKLDADQLECMKMAIQGTDFNVAHRRSRSQQVLPHSTSSVTLQSGTFVMQQRHLIPTKESLYLKRLYDAIIQINSVTQQRQIEKTKSPQVEFKSFVEKWFGKPRQKGRKFHCELKRVASSHQRFSSSPYQPYRLY